MKKNKTRFLYIHLEVQDGERRHDHRVLHITRANNIDFAAERYVSTFWGEGKHDGAWWYYGECSGRLVKVEELTKKQYNYLNDLFY